MSRRGELDRAHDGCEIRPDSAGAEVLEEPADLTRHRLLGFTKWFDETTWRLSNGSRTERVPTKLWVGINDYTGEGLTLDGFAC